jgi:hypothetical protein
MSRTGLYVTGGGFLGLGIALLEYAAYLDGREEQKTQDTWTKATGSPDESGRDDFPGNAA